MEPPEHRDTGLLPERYRDPVLIAIGGMAAVYRAHDERLGRDVAVKVPSDAIAADETASRRFRREAVSAARIHHPNVALVYDVGEHRGRSYMVMELVPGGTLADRLAQGRPSRAAALAWIAQTAAALDAAHAAGVVHRDVKPANLLLDADDRVKVADFGIARVLDEQAASITAPGTVLGTSGYASPEQAEGLPATPASDVYALAAVAHELLTGTRPRTPFVRTADRHPAVSFAVEEVLAWGLAQDPAERFASAGEFAAALRAALADPGRTTAVIPAAASPAPPSPRRRGRALATAAAIVAVAGGATAGAMMIGDGDGGSPSAVEAQTGVRTVVETVTRETPAAPPQTVVETVTTEAPAPEPAPAAPPAQDAGGPTADEAVALTDQSTAALDAGDAATGLVLAEEALLALAGTGADYEGNASYNRGRALIDLGRCGEAVEPLQRSVAIGGTDWQEATRRDALDEARRCDTGGD